jgi:hypothetical protein
VQKQERNYGSAIIGSVGLLMFLRCLRQAEIVEEGLGLISFLWIGVYATESGIILVKLWYIYRLVG